MSAPRLHVRLDRIRHNASTLVGRLARHGIDVTGVTKATLGSPEVATAMLEAGVTRLGDSRMVVLGSLVRAAGMAVFAFLTAAWQAPLGSVLFAFGMGVMMPPLQSLATRAVGTPDEVAAVAASLNG